MHIDTSANVNCLRAPTPVALERSRQGVRRWPSGKTAYNRVKDYSDPCHTWEIQRGVAVNL